MVSSLLLPRPCHSFVPWAFAVCFCSGPPPLLCLGAPEGGWVWPLQGCCCWGRTGTDPLLVAEGRRGPEEGGALRPVPLSPSTASVHRRTSGPEGQTSSARGREKGILGGTQGELKLEKLVSHTGGPQSARGGGRISTLTVTSPLGFSTGHM